jgi:uncharacterized repeat protein (TIGR01451 family)
VANFTFTPPNGVDPLLVTFTNTSTGTISSYNWTFGDGGTSNLASPTYTYNLPGVYTITLQVTGPGGSNSTTQTITVQAGADIDVSISASPLTPAEGSNVTYTVTASNNGPNSATNLRLSIPVPAAMIFTQATPSQGSYNAGTWTVGTVNQGGNATLTLVLRVRAGTAGNVITTSASLLSLTQLDPNNANDLATADIIPTPPIVSLDLQVNLSAPGSVTVGNNVNYVATVRNNGPSTATNIEVQFTTTPAMTIGSHLGGGSFSPATGRWTLTTLAVGSTATLNIAINATSGLAGQTLDGGLALVSLTQTDTNSSNNSATTSTTINPQDLRLQVNANPTGPFEADTIVYTVVVDNRDIITMTGVEVTVVLDGNVTLQSQTVPPATTYDPLTGLWMVGSVSPGTTFTLQLNATVNAGTSGQTIPFSASITALNEPDSNPGNNTDNQNITVQFRDLAISKSVNVSTPYEGDTIVFTVTVTNRALSPFTAIEVTDLLPSGLTYSANSPSQGSYNPGTGLWSVGTLNAGASATLQLTVTVDAGTGGTSITNTASITNSAEPDPNPGNDSASRTVNPRVFSIDADLAVTLTVIPAQPTFNEGELVGYRLRVQNNGPADASGVEINFDLPPGMTHNSVSTVPQGTYNNTNGRWNVGNLNSGQSVELTHYFTIDGGTAGSIITNDLAVSASSQPDPDPSNNTRNASVTVAGTDLSITKTVNNATPLEGSTVIYTLTVTNGGPQDTTSVEVSDLIPSGLIYTTHSASQGSYDPITGVWAVGSLLNTANATLTIEATVAAGTANGTLTNTASLTVFTITDTNTGNNQASVDVVPRLPNADIAVSMTAAPLILLVGDSVTYTIDASSLGPDASSGVQLGISLPPQFSLTSDSTTAGTYNAGAGIWILDVALDGAPQTLTLTGTILDDNGGAPMNASAWVTALDQIDPNPGNDTASAAITASYPAPIASFNASATTVLTNEVISFTDTSTGGPITTWAWDFGDGNSSNTQNPTHSYPSAGAYNVTLTVTGPGGSNASPITVITVNNPPQADLLLTQTVDNPAPQQGNSVFYELTLTNQGPDTATGITVAFVLPSPDLSPLSITPSQGSYDGTTWTVGDVASGISVTLTASVQVDAIAGTVISTDATASLSSPTDPDSANNLAPLSITVSP